MSHEKLSLVHRCTLAMSGYSGQTAVTARIEPCHTPESWPADSLTRSPTCRELPSPGAQSKNEQCPSMRRRECLSPDQATPPCRSFIGYRISALQKASLPIFPRYEISRPLTTSRTLRKCRKTHRFGPKYGDIASRQRNNFSSRVTLAFAGLVESSTRCGIGRMPASSGDAFARKSFCAGWPLKQISSICG